jgi:hypothetical protein
VDVAGKALAEAVGVTVTGGVPGVEGEVPGADRFFRDALLAGALDVVVAPVVRSLAEDPVGEAGVLVPVGADERRLGVEGIRRRGR